MEISRTYTVNFPTPGGEFEKRYPALLRVPYIRSPDLKYHRLASRYLMERALNGWVPEHRVRKAARSNLSLISRKTYAEALIDFLKYSDHFKVDAKTCTYWKDILHGYQKRMLERKWPLTENGVGGSTPESRVQQACDYLSWMAEKGLREPFQIPYETISVDSWQYHREKRNASPNEVEARIGRLKKPETVLTIPPDEEVRSWLNGIRREHPKVYELMCKSVPLTALRREEVVCLRRDTLPENQEHWRTPNKFAPEAHRVVLIEVSFGCKGPDLLAVDRHGDKIGKSRTIQIPLSLAKEWHEYRGGARKDAVKIRIARAKESGQIVSEEDCVHLFLDPDTGRKIKGKKLWKIWTSVDRPLGWHIRAGRHWWACSKLWRAISKWLGSTDTEFATGDLIERESLSVIDLVIRPQLGHVSKETTLMYLRWVQNMVSIPLSLDAVDELQDDRQFSLF
jgi:hypothetical protein